MAKRSTVLIFILLNISGSVNHCQIYIFKKFIDSFVVKIYSTNLLSCDNKFA